MGNGEETNGDEKVWHGDAQETFGLSDKQAAGLDEYDVKQTGQPGIWNLWQGGKRWNAAMGGLSQQEDIKARGQYGTDKPGDIAKALTLENLRKYRQAPETFGLSEAEKQASADKAAAASGAAMATGLAKGTREMMGGGTTGYASQAMRETAAPTRQAAATASQQATALSKQMIEQKGNELYAQLTGRPMPPPLGQQMLAAGGTAALTAGGKAFGEYVGGYLGGEPADPYADVNFSPTSGLGATDENLGTGVTSTYMGPPTSP